MLAVLAPLKLKEDAVLEGSKALGTDEAPGVSGLADNLKKWRRSTLRGKGLRSS